MTNSKLEFLNLHRFITDSETLCLGATLGSQQQLEPPGHMNLGEWEASVPFGRGTGGKTEPGDIFLRARVAGDFHISSEQYI